MPKDYANIYNLPEAERELEKKDLWKDSVPGTEELAKNILKKIEEDEYPYVLSVEAGYGMGKTYFFSRFCEQAIKDGFDCIYISAWENDYQPSPFLFICNKIKGYMEQKKQPIVKSQLSEFVSSSRRLIMEIVKNADMNIGPKEIAQIKIKNIISLFCKSKLDSVQNFKIQLKELITTTQTKPLILVIDELDRCRPDYAIKTLEVIKHFFDVDNLYVILPINKEAIDYAVSAIYGDKNNNSENYLKKLITQNLVLPQPTSKYYEKIAKTIITEQKLKKQLKQKYIEKNNNYNGFNIISECIGKYASAGKLTYRETIKVCDEFIGFTNNIKRKIHLEYLIYKLCNKHVGNKINLNGNHPFYEMRNSYSEGHGTKSKILTIDGLYSQTHGLSRYVNQGPFYKNFENEVRTWERNDKFKSYDELYSFINSAKTIKDEIFNIPFNYNIKERLNWFFEAIQKKEAEAKEYQNKYGSDDKDSETQAYYDKLIENPLSMYEK